MLMRRASTLAVLTGLATIAVASEALAVVRLTIETVPARPIAGQPFHLVYGLHVQNDRMAQATPLQFPGLTVLANAAPPSTANMMFGGFGGMGTFTVQSSAEYILVAPRAGRYTVIGGGAVDPQSGQTVARIAARVIEVLPAGSQPPQAAQPAQPAQPAMPGMFPPGMFPPGVFPPGMMTPDTPQPEPQPTVADPDAPPAGEVGAQFDPAGFVRVSIDNATPYVGQQVTLRIWLYVPSTEVVCDVQREPQLTGFWNEPLIDRGQIRCARQWFRQVVGGREMAAGLVRKIALFPTRAGRLEVGAPEVIGEYIEGDGFFGQRRQITARGPSVGVDAREPPTDGRPAGYVPGRLGPLQVQAELDRAAVPTGETVTLRLRATGNGYLGAVGLPAIAPVEGVRMHEGASHHDVDRADERDVKGNLTVEYLLVPERPGAHALGTLSVPWFDPTDGRYHTTTVALPTITATGAALERDEEERREDPTIALDPIETSPSLDGYRPFFTTPLRVWGAVALPPLALVVAGLARAFRRLRESRRAAREDLARNDPSSLMAQSELALSSGDEARAADLAGRALEKARKEYGIERLDDGGRAALREAQEACDTLRFGGAGSTRDAVEKVRAAVRAMEAAS